MKLTAVQAGYYIVSVDGVDVSKHITEREAIETSVNRVRPGNDVRYRHDYVVIVQPSVIQVASLTGASMQLNGE